MSAWMLSNKTIRLAKYIELPNNYWVRLFALTLALAGLIQTPFAKLLCFHDEFLHSEFSKVSEHTDHDEADEHTHTEASHVHKHRHSPDEPEHEHSHSHLATSFYDYSIYFKVAPAHEYPLVVEHHQFGYPSEPKFLIVNADIFRPPICA